MSNTYDLPVWEQPKSYSGFSPIGDYLIYTINRDSALLEKSNWHCMYKELETECAKHPEPENDGEHNQGATWFYTFRANHFLVGWVECMLIRKDAPESIQKLASEILGVLSDYPILNEFHYSDLQHNEIYSYWENCGLREKMDLCIENDISVFSARHDHIPDRVYDDLSFYTFY